MPWGLVGFNMGLCWGVSQPIFNFLGLDLPMLGGTSAVLLPIFLESLATFWVSMSAV